MTGCWFAGQTEGIQQREGLLRGVLNLIWEETERSLHPPATRTHINFVRNDHILAQEPVTLDIGKPLSDIPATILNKCVRGKHSPVVPHAQRLLVAAHKDAKEVQPEDGKRKRVTGKGGVKDKVGPEKPQISAADEKATGEAPEPTEPRKRVLTAYGVARADYINALLGLMWANVLTLGLKLLALPPGRSESRCWDPRSFACKGLCPMCRVHVFPG